MFTQDNTEGYTDAELALMNIAASALVALGMDESNAIDIVGNNYHDGNNTVESLSGGRAK